MAGLVRAASSTPALRVDADFDRAATKGSRRGAADREVSRALPRTLVGARRLLPRPRLGTRPGLASARTLCARRTRPPPCRPPAPAPAREASLGAARAPPGSTRVYGRSGGSNARWVASPPAAPATRRARRR